MRIRTKWFLGILAGAVVFAASYTGQPKILVVAALIAAGFWLVWRAFAFLVILLRPAREVVKPQVDALNAHVDSAMRRSGMSGLADAAAKVQTGLDGAVRVAERSIDERRS